MSVVVRRAGALLLLALAPLAAGQDVLLEPPHGPAEGGLPGWDSFVRGGGASYRAAGAGGASLDLDRYELGLGVERRVRSGVLGLTLDHQRLGYGGDWTLGGLTAPLATADHYRLQAAWHAAEGDGLTWSLGARAEAGSDRAADPFGDPALGATLGLELELTDGLGLELSLDALERLEDDPRLVPLALVDARLTDDLRLGRVAGGYGLDWDWDLETRWFVALDRDERQFRLDEDHGGHAVVRDRETSLRAGMLWQPQPDLELELCVGRAERRLSLHEDATALDRLDVDETTFFGVRLAFGPGALF